MRYVHPLKHIVERVDLVRSGMRPSDAARRLGIDAHQVSQAVARWAPELLRGRRRHSESLVEAVLSRYEAGVTFAQIAAATNLTRGTVAGIVYRQKEKKWTT